MSLKSFVLTFAAAIGFAILYGGSLAGQQMEEHDEDSLREEVDYSQVKVDVLPAAEEQINELTAELRRSEGVQKLSVDPELLAAARYFADFMARTDKYGHTADGARPADRAKDHGYEYCIVLENIAYYSSSRRLPDLELSQSFFEGWKESPGHLKNMLDPDVHHVASGVAYNPETGNCHAVQMFGRPKTAQIEFELSNPTDWPMRYSVSGRTFVLPPSYTRTHHRCRPPELQLIGPAPAATEGAAEPNAESAAVEAESAPTGELLRPKHGSQFQIEETRNGEFEIVPVGR